MNKDTKPSRHWLRNIGLFFAGLIVLLAIIAAFNAREIFRFWKVVTLFDKQNITENFQNMAGIFPYHEVKNGDPVYQFKKNPRQLPETCRYNGKSHNFLQLMKDTRTTGLLVLKDDTIVFEDYYLGADENSLHISWSVGKSFVSALIGIAIDEGYIKSINDPVSDYAPELKGSGYDGVPLKDVLQMSSGVKFNEDYADFYSDINRMGRTTALGNSINGFAASLKSERSSGEYHHYVSMDTQVLGMVLKNAIGITPAQYLEEKIWKQIGMQASGKWLVDDLDMELVFGTLNVTTRDYARFGKLYMDGGNWQGKQIVPAQWVKDSITPDAPHLQPGVNPLSSSKMGYGYQWWIPEFPQGDFMALGVYGQYIYINPGKKVVIVKNSADSEWRSGADTNYITMSCFQTVANEI
ncbi:beta-lactamase family protein [bacterium]|nr:beta-lactamase family protein [bacterium]